MGYKFLDGFLTEKELMILNTVKDLNLTKDEVRTLRWISGWEFDAVCNICSIIKKAKEYGRPLAEIRRKLGGISNDTGNVKSN